jgi:hypothetical protein
MAEVRNAYRTLVGNAEGRRPLGRRRSRSENNIEMDLSEIVYEGASWIPLSHDRTQW